MADAPPMGSADWDRRYAATDLMWSAGPNATVRDLVAGMAPGKALDLACGEGRNALWLAAEGWEVTGVDFSRVAVDRAGRLATERGLAARFIHADLGEWAPPAEAFDLVLLAYLQVPAALRGTVIEAAAAAVAPGGTLLWVAHDVENLERGYGGPRDAAVLSTPEGVVARLSGLQVTRAERIERPVDTDAGPATAIDTLVLAVRPA
ncbi:MAG: class I SAM-dependent methyltransferase [Thermoleophilia bacterium]